jgi:hypothetical protein
MIFISIYGDAPESRRTILTGLERFEQDSMPESAYQEADAEELFFRARLNSARVR